VSEYDLRMGAGWVADAVPGLSDEERVKIERETEAERRRAERERADRADQAAEKRAVLDLPGRPAVGRTMAETLAFASAGMDHADRIEARRERTRLEAEGRPVPEHLQLNRFEMEKRHREREAAAEVTPASQAEVGREVGRVEAALDRLKRQLTTIGPWS